MKVKLIGLGKMGSNIALNLKMHGHEVIGFDTNQDAVKYIQSQDIVAVETLDKLLETDENQRQVVLLFIPNEVVDHLIELIVPFLRKNDIVIDGGNSNFNVSIKRYHNLKSIGVDFVDLASGGGTYGARYGASLMVGGDKNVIDYLEPMFLDLSKEGGYAYVGRPGTGHFVKMVQNGIEYGMMQAIAEGFDLLEASPFQLDYQQISSVWNHGSIIESTLMGYIHQAFHKDATLSDIKGKIDDSGEGMWMIQEALKYKVSLPVITQSLYTRFKSKDDHQFAEKIVAAMRKEFGGHTVYKK